MTISRIVHAVGYASAAAMGMLALSCSDSTEPGADAGGGADAQPDGGEACIGAPPPEATVRVGQQDTGFVLPGGRMLTPFGIQAVVGGFPADIRMHPKIEVAYIANTGYGNAFRSVQVVNSKTGDVLQDVVRGDSFYGITLTADGNRLYASGGFSSMVDVYDVGSDGKLSPNAQIPVDKYPAGLALSDDGTRLWVGQFKGNAVAEVDTATFSVVRSFSVPFGAYNVLSVPERNELYVAGFADDKLAVVDLSPAGAAATTVTVGGNPLGLAKSPSGDRVFAAVSNGDVLVAIDTSTRQIVATQAVGEASIAGAAGTPLPASSPGALVLSPSGKQLFAARAADNAIGVYDPATLNPLGAIPVGWYPTGVAVSPDGNWLLATNGKGVGTGPLPNYKADSTGKLAMRGSLSIVELAKADLPTLAAKVEANARRPDRVYPFACDKPFPIPVNAGDKSPIEHIVLIIRENKTYDCLLGDLDRGERDPSLTLYGEKITPNIHALARAFTNHDNFYDDSETSVQGHLWLTSSFVNDYIERTWFEDYRNHPGWGADPILKQGRPSFLTFFTHLMKNGIDFRIYGEIVGATDTFGGQSVSNFSDSNFPGGGIINYDVHDEDKAKYVAQKLVDEESFPAFVYVVFPNDHTKGYSSGALTPEAMISDNDYATGLLIDRISHSKFWASTAIFVVEDDPQTGGDHIDYHRSIHVVASPWAKRSYVSSVHASYPSLFRTFEKILGIGPMNRYDALATPLWDAFRTKPDLAPFDALPRQVPDALNPSPTRLSALSDAMDWSGPDRNPDLGDLLAWGHFGSPPPGSRIAHMTPSQLRGMRHDDDD